MYLNSFCLLTFFKAFKTHFQNYSSPRFPSFSQLVIAFIVLPKLFVSFFLFISLLSHLNCFYFIFSLQSSFSIFSASSKPSTVYGFPPVFLSYANFFVRTELLFDIFCLIFSNIFFGLSRPSCTLHKSHTVLYVHTFYVFSPIVLARTKYIFFLSICPAFTSN